MQETRSMAASTSNDSGVLTELQRAAFGRWKDSQDYMDLAMRLQLRESHHLSRVGREEQPVAIGLNVREDGSVDVLMTVHGVPTSSSFEEFKEIDMPLYQEEDPVKSIDESTNATGDPCVVNLDRPRRLYLYFLELQRLKAAKSFEFSNVSRSGSPKQPTYEGGLSELQRAAFTRWSDDELANKTATSVDVKVSTMNILKIADVDPSVLQPTMATFKDDSVLELQPLLK